MKALFTVTSNRITPLFGTMKSSAADFGAARQAIGVDPAQLMC